MRSLLLTCLAVFALSLSSAANAWESHKKPEAAGADPTSETVKVVRWEGSTDIDMLKQVRSDIESATAKDSKIKTLRVSIVSGGGPVITSLEIARLVRDASDKGLVVEFHAEALCASGCTFVLAAGTPGHRYISKWALFLVHPPQGGGMFGAPVCIEHVDEPKTQEDKITDVLFDLMRDSYVRYTGQKPEDVEKWLTCGNELAGAGAMAVSLHIADVAE